MSRQEFFEIYRLSAIQRDLKVVGRFYYLDLVKGKPGYMKFVPPTVRRLQRNLAQVAQTQPILPLLSEHFEAMLRPQCQCRIIAKGKSRNHDRNFALCILHSAFCFSQDRGLS